MKFYIEPIGDIANSTIAAFMSLRESTIEIQSSTMSGVDGKQHSVYITEDHNLITYLKKSKNIVLNRDFKIYVFRGGLLVPSYIDHCKK